MKPALAPQMVIVQDSREQRPYIFPDLLTIRGTLKTGDYSVCGLESVACVERKELSDFIGVCTHGRERWERELERAGSIKRLWIVIEGSLVQISKHQYRSEANPECIIGSIAAWECRFDPVRFLFCSDRQTGQRITAKLLSRAWKEFSGGASRTGLEMIE